MLALTAWWRASTRWSTSKQFEYDALGNSTKYGYDKARRLTKVKQTCLIDDVLADIKKTEQQVTTYEHNQKGLVTLVHLPLEKTVKLSYNGIENITSKLDEDELGRAKKVVDFEGKAVGYKCNELGQREKTIYPDEKDHEFPHQHRWDWSKKPPRQGAEPCLE